MAAWPWGAPSWWAGPRSAMAMLPYRPNRLLATPPTQSTSIPPHGLRPARCARDREPMGIARGHLRHRQRVSEHARAHLELADGARERGALLRRVLRGEALRRHGAAGGLLCPLPVRLVR